PRARRRLASRMADTKAPVSSRHAWSLILRREHMSSIPASTEVLIVGAGPTGLALATSLTQTGVDHVLIDRLDGALNTSRAAVMHAHTLEALGELQVAEPLAAAGLKLSRFTIRDRDETLVNLDFAGIAS